MAQKPILLLADSQTLFWQSRGHYFLQLYFNKDLPENSAYIGASNGDRPEYFEIFKAAMETAGIRNHFFIQKNFTESDRSHLESADLILLAGGDIKKGWQIIKESGMAELIIDRYYHGAYLIGISAGAIQIGLHGFDEELRLFETLKCLPMIVDVHQEAQHWQRLKQALVSIENKYIQGIGLPTASGLIYHTDHSVEAVRKPISLFARTDSGLKQQLILPAKFRESSQIEGSAQ